MEKKITKKQIKKMADAAIVANSEKTAAYKEANATALAILEGDAAPVATDTPNGVATPAEIEAAAKAVEAALKSIRAEVLSPRAVCRVIRDLIGTDAVIDDFAAKLGLKADSNKAGIDAAAKRLYLLMPYRIVTKIPTTDGKINEIVNGVTWQPTATDGVLVARPCKDVFQILRAALTNAGGQSQEVKNGKFYRITESGKAEETDKVNISKTADEKKAAKIARLKKLMQELDKEDVMRVYTEIIG